MQVVQDDRRLLERIGGIVGQALVSTAAREAELSLDAEAIRWSLYTLVG